MGPLCSLTTTLTSQKIFQGNLSPLEKTKKNFQGMFVGQGHKIGNLVMNSSLVHVGLFGYASGAMIRNVVLDTSCSVFMFLHILKQNICLELLVDVATVQLKTLLIWWALFSQEEL